MHISATQKQNTPVSSGTNIITYLITHDDDAVFEHPSTFFIHSFIQLLLLNSPQIVIVSKDLKFKSNNSIRQGGNRREWGRKGGGCLVFPRADLSTLSTIHALVVWCSDAVWQWLDRSCWLWIYNSSTGPCKGGGGAQGLRFESRACGDLALMQVKNMSRVLYRI